jgi:hypothetical protein
VSVRRSKPRFWFWSHDIQPDQIEGLAMPGMRLQRLEQQHGYPLDLDAIGHGLSVRFAVIAAA